MGGTASTEWRGEQQTEAADAGAGPSLRLELGLDDLLPGHQKGIALCSSSAAFLPGGGAGARFPRRARWLRRTVGGYGYEREPLLCARVCRAVRAGFVICATRQGRGPRIRCVVGTLRQ